MLDLLIRAVTSFAMGRHEEGEQPEWASDLLNRFSATEQLVRSLHRKVNTFMSQDRDNLARLTAVVAGLIPVLRAKLAENDSLTAENADLKNQLGVSAASLSQAQADAASDSADDLAAQAPLSDALDALDALVNGPQTPDVAPVPPEQAPAVLNGSQDATAPDGSPLPSGDAVS